MKTPPPERAALRDYVVAAASASELRAPGEALCWRDARTSTVLGDARDALAGRSVLVGPRSQLAGARVMLELDGIVARMVIVPPDVSAERLDAIVAQAEVDVIICDEARDLLCPTLALRAPRPAPAALTTRITEWVMPTSGTTGAPKLVAHRLAGLVGAATSRDLYASAPVWGTFYDIRRYGGMQIFLRAAIAGATLVITDADEPLVAFVERLARAGVTHLTGTPSHWRKLLMSPHAARIAPRYVRLSGEIADRAILDALRSAYPAARIVHAYASTEAGVGFEVDDGREGFPADYLDGVGGVEMRVVDGALRIRSARTARRYVGRDDLSLRDADGFVDTDDLVEIRGDRCLFRGRRTGAINVGGLKVHPEEVEQIINLHDAVRMSLVKARRNPIMGDIVVAQVLLKDEGASPERQRTLRDEILSACRARLDRRKAPAMIDFVAALPVSAGGKLVRGG